MSWLFLLVLALHAITAVFWAGATFVLARHYGPFADRLVPAQLGAATFAILTGAALFALAHSQGVGPMEHGLLAGAVVALIAAIAQGWMRRSNPALAQRIAAPLLVIALICMVTARYWT